MDIQKLLRTLITREDIPTDIKKEAEKLEYQLWSEDITVINMMDLAEEIRDSDDIGLKSSDIFDSYSSELYQKAEGLNEYYSLNPEERYRIEH